MCHDICVSSATGIVGPFPQQDPEQLALQSEVINFFSHVSISSPPKGPK